jgi:4-amino-4-deoxy-L-arabinose transferase-like glycosyltransferase
VDKIIDYLSERRIPVILLVLLALFSQILLIMAVPKETARLGDADEYLSIARNVEHLKFYSFDGITPTRMRQPLYPFFLATVQSLFGPSVLYVQLAQVSINILTILLFRSLANKLWGKKTGFVVLVSMCLFLPLLNMSKHILTETFYVFLLALFLYVGVLAIRKKSKGLIASSGSILGAVTLCRPTTIFLPIVIVPILGCAFSTIRGRGISLIAIFLGGFCAMLVPWGVRNYLTLGEFAVISSDGGANLWVATQPDWREYLEGSMGRSWTKAEFLKIKADEHYHSSEADKRFIRQAVANIRFDPWGFVWRNAQKIVIFAYWNYLFPFKRLAGHGPVADVLVMSVRLMFLAMVAIGFVKSWERRGEALLVISVAFYLTVAYFASFVTGRFMIPVVPVMLLFGSHGFMIVVMWLADKGLEWKESEGNA